MKSVHEPDPNRKNTEQCPPTDRHVGAVRTPQHTSIDELVNESIHNVADKFVNQEKPME